MWDSGGMATAGWRRGRGQHSRRGRTSCPYAQSTAAVCAVAARRSQRRVRTTSQVRAESDGPHPLSFTSGLDARACRTVPVSAPTPPTNSSSPAPPPARAPAPPRTTQSPAPRSAERSGRNTQRTHDAVCVCVCGKLVMHGVAVRRQGLDWRCVGEWELAQRARRRRCRRGWWGTSRTR